MDFFFFVAALTSSNFLYQTTSKFPWKIVKFVFLFCAKNNIIFGKHFVYTFPNRIKMLLTQNSIKFVNSFDGNFAKDGKKRKEFAKRTKNSHALLFPWIETFIYLCKMLLISLKEVINNGQNFPSISKFQAIFHTKTHTHIYICGTEKN